MARTQDEGHDGPGPLVPAAGEFSTGASEEESILWALEGQLL